MSTRASARCITRLLGQALPHARQVELPEAVLAPDGTVRGRAADRQDGALIIGDGPPPDHEATKATWRGTG